MSSMSLAVPVLPNPTRKAPKGFCQCGCGRKTKLAPQSHTRLGWVRGEPMNYVHGHSRRVGPGAHNWTWNGGKKRGKGGYVLILSPAHPGADEQGYVAEHRLVMEKLLGRLLLPLEQVHHVNERKDDNRPGNLWVFPSNSAHAAWHMFLRYGTLTCEMASVPLGA